MRNTDWISRGRCVTGIGCARIFHGDLGPSFAYNSPVAPLLAVRARNTLLLTGTAMMLAWLIAIPLGIVSAMQRGKWSDRAGGVVTSALLTIPDLVLFLGILLLAVRTGWFPTGGMVSTAFGELSAWGKTKDIAYHLFLPALGLASRLCRRWCGTSARQ